MEIMKKIASFALLIAALVINVNAADNTVPKYDFDIKNDTEDTLRFFIISKNPNGKATGEMQMYDVEGNAIPKSCEKDNTCMQKKMNIVISPKEHYEQKDVEIYFPATYSYFINNARQGGGSIDRQFIRTFPQKNGGSQKYEINYDKATNRGVFKISFDAGNQKEKIEM